MLEKEETSGETIKLTRRDFLKFIAGGSLTALLAACGITPKEMEEAPFVSIEELSSRPDLYTELPLIKTIGYPEQTGKKVLSVPIITIIGKVTQFNWLTTETDTYKLHPQSDAKSISVDFMISGGSTYLPGAPFPPSGSNLMIKDKYQITGKITKVREGDNKTEKYMLQSSDVRKTEVSTPVPGK